MLSVVLKIAKLHVYVFRDIPEMQKQNVKNLELFHARETLAELTAIVKIHQMVQNANVKMDVLEMLSEDALAMMNN
jgi:predicted Fe-Mo cluster-binding NifX family protein